MRRRTHCTLVWSAWAGSAILRWWNREYFKFGCEWILGEGEQDENRAGAWQGRGLWAVIALEGVTMRVAGISMVSLFMGIHKSFDPI